MEQGAKKLAQILLAAVLLGFIVVALNPAYRNAFLNIMRGTPAESPIWQSNIKYYPDISLPGLPDAAADATADAVAVEPTPQASQPE